MKIYAIFEGEGEYEDYKEQPYKAFISKEKADLELALYRAQDNAGQKAFNAVVEKVVAVRGRHASPNVEELEEHAELFKSIAGFEASEWKTKHLVMYEIDVDEE